MWSFKLNVYYCLKFIKNLSNFISYYVQIAVLQSSSKKVTLICLESMEQHDIQISIILKGLHMGEKYLALWDNQNVGDI